MLELGKARKRYERQGLLVESEAIKQAECLADEDVRARRRERAAMRSAAQDRKYTTRFAENIRDLFPACPNGEGATLLRAECRAADFVRRFTVADGIDVDKISASLTDGVLQLRLPKTAAVKPRKIEIKGG